MNNFGTRKLMSWNKLKDGELAIMDNNGNWRPYTALPFVKNLGLDREFFEDMSKGYRTMQILLKQGWIIVNKEDY